MEYNREQREILLSLAKAEIKKQETRAQLKEVSFILDWSVGPTYTFYCGLRFELLLQIIIFSAYSVMP